MIKNLPTVSFIIPTLNASKILERCLETIRSQDYPKAKVEIVIADGGSTDSTIRIAKKYGARIYNNPEILHEPGKALASSKAKGEILFFTDSDNILSTTHWISDMVKPYLENTEIKGFLPQTIPPVNWFSFDRYMGYLATDPFTWFIYRWASVPRTYGDQYKPIKETNSYKIYKFTTTNYGLLGLSQGFGTVSSFKRDKMGHNDDILSGIKLISEGGLIVHVPSCGIYHYHVENFSQFVHKYTWRVRNNLNKRVNGMGLVYRQQFLNRSRKFRQFFFPFYSVSLLFPIFDSLKLFLIYKDPVVFWHPVGCILLTLIITKETFLFILGFKIQPGKY